MSARMETSFESNYKQWMVVLRAKLSHFNDSYLAPLGDDFDHMCELFDICLASMNKMPRIWTMYLEFLIDNRDITRFRRAVNGAVQALPITQHFRIWDIVLNKFLLQTEFTVPIRSCKALFKRYIQLVPAYRDQYVDFLIERDQFTDAVLELLDILRKEEGDSLRYMNYFKLVNIISKHSNRIDSSVRSSVDLPEIIRAGLAKFPDELGNLWNHLADYYIRLGEFSEAMEIYEEALGSISTVVDFSLVFNSYQSFLDLLIKSRLESAKTTEQDRLLIELDMLRLESLLDRRSGLLSLVVLRSNPNNVVEWIKRTKLPSIANNPESVVGTFNTAISTVDAETRDTHKPLIGRMSMLWTEYAQYLFKHRGDINAARSVFEKAIAFPFKNLDDLASVWVEYVLMEIRLELQGIHDVSDDAKNNIIPNGSSNFAHALEISRRSINQYRGASKGTIQSSLHRSMKLWYLALDLETSVNGVAKPDLVRAIYSTMLELKVITPQTLLSYSQFEYNRGLFEKSVQILEKGVALFPWPYCRDIWIYYLNQVKGSTAMFSTERVRDLFESVLSSECPPKDLPVFYFQYFSWELDHGLGSNAISVALRAVAHVQLEDRPAFVYAAVFEAMKLQGGNACRRIFQEQIKALEYSKGGKFYDSNSAALDKIIIELCMQFSTLETTLESADRARKILEHGSQFANPSKYEYFWDFWKNFEITHGTEETYKEMKRVRRAVDVMYADKHFNSLDAGMEVAADIAMAPEHVEKVAAAKPPSVAGIDLSKLQSAAADGVSGIPKVHADPPIQSSSFIRADKFEGSKPGYKFTTGPSGLGYYRDSR